MYMMKGVKNHPIITIVQNDKYKLKSSNKINSVIKTIFDRFTVSC